MSIILCTLVKPLPLWGSPRKISTTLSRPRVAQDHWLKKKKNLPKTQHSTLWMAETNCNALFFSLLHSPSLPYLSSSSRFSFSLFFLHQFPFPVPSLAGPPAPLGHLYYGVRVPAQRNQESRRAHSLATTPTAFPFPFSPPKMDVTRLFLATLLVCLCFLTAHSHLAPEENPRDDRSLGNNSSIKLLDSPSVSIVGK